MSSRVKDIAEIEKRDKDKQFINDIKKRLREAKEPINSEIDELQYITKPIGNVIYKGALEEKTVLEEKRRRRAKWNPTERVTCDLCGKSYTRSNKSIHERTNYHIAYKTVNDKFKQLILK